MQALLLGDSEERGWLGGIHLCSWYSEIRDRKIANIANRV